MPSEERWVIPRKRIPTHAFKMVWPAAVLWLYLDRYHAPAWLMGVLGTLVGMTFVGLLTQMFRERSREILFRPDSQEEIQGRRFPDSWKKNKIST